MATQDLKLLQAAIEKVHWHEQRQKVLSQNIANANTPGYQAQDVAPLDFKTLLEGSSSSLSLSMATTDPKHLGLNGTSVSRQHAVQKQKNTYGVSPNGNSVVMEEQLLKMNENFTDHRLTTTIYQKNIDMLKSSIRSQ
ncbi:MAG: flagellar basal body rod protein FlgB [Proteobacteria bacterium]|nr:flagellar basal body rod protein FlgB [Pseudomonadota bacterium]